MILLVEVSTGMRLVIESDLRLAHALNHDGKSGRHWCCDAQAKEHVDCVLC